MPGNYDNFCLFCHIEDSTKKKDHFAFWIFFTFKGMLERTDLGLMKDWKRLLLADGPRQSINALVLYSFGYANGFQTSNLPAYWDNSAITAMLLFSIMATVLIFAVSMILLITAGVLYVPLLCYIRGNLKEYVCHKVDKRIAELVKRKQRQRAAKMAAQEKQYIQEKMGASAGAELTALPTLPNVKLEEGSPNEVTYPNYPAWPASAENAEQTAYRNSFPQDGC